MDTDTARTPLALVTGASRGLGRALVSGLLGRGWRVVVDARDADRLAEAVAGLSVPYGAVDGGGPGDGRAAGPRVVAVPGDVADPAHRRALADAVAAAGGTLDLLVNNASVLGPSPQPRLADYPLDVLEHVYAVNTVAPLALAQLLLPALSRSTGPGLVVNISSDAAVEAYEGWGGYGSSKAALDQLSAVLAAEHPGLRVYAVDPGDMATDLHQQAFPGEDISDRAAPESVVPALLRLIGAGGVAGGLPSGRYRAADLPAADLPGGGQRAEVSA